jgi:hypothetical protein
MTFEEPKDEERDLSKYRCNYCKSPNILVEKDWDSRDYWNNYLCGACGLYLSLMRLETMLLEEKIQSIPGFICVLNGNTEIILHAKQANDAFPKEWGGYSIKFIDHSQDKSHDCRNCKTTTDEEGSENDT